MERAKRIHSRGTAAILSVGLVIFCPQAFAAKSTQPARFIRGDVNADGQVNLTDGVCIATSLFLGGACLKCQDAADANDDGSLDISDPIFLLNRLFLGGLRIPPPSFCDPDPTADSLDCAASSCSQSSGTIWTSAQELAGRPTSGPAWANLKAAADSTPPDPNLSDQDDEANVFVLAKALVYARTGQARYRNEVIALCMRTIDTELAGRTLSLGRELVAYVIAADLVGLEPEQDQLFSAWLRRTLRENLDGRTLRSTHEDRPNNWGTHAGASRAAVAAYLGDRAELARTAAVFKGWLGDRGSYTGFTFGDLSWQADPDRPVGVNPKGALKEGNSIDGALPDDMRRGGPFQFPPLDGGSLYPWEALQGAVVQAEILHRAGYDAFEWEDQALLRAVRFLYSIGWAAEGDDQWQIWIINHRYGTSLPAAVRVEPGKNMGWTDWTHAGPAGSEPPPPDDPPPPPPPPPPEEEELALVRGPYLQLGTPTSIIVRWRTSLPIDSFLKYGVALDRLEATLSEATPKRNHEILIQGLSPYSTYYYAVGTSSEIFAGDDGSCHFRTAPETGNAVPTRVWALGDSGTANSSARAVRDAYRAFSRDADTNLWLMLGDNAYDSGSDSQYQRAVFDMYRATLRTSVLWPTLGNHDGKSANSSTQSGPYYDIFTLPTRAEAGGMPSGTEAYYSFDYSNAHFICLDSHESDRSRDGAMLRWMAADLDSTSQPWVIAFWHHPPYSKGSHDSDSEGQLIDMREEAVPILEAGGVDLVLCGHSHSYERTYLIDGHYGDSDSFGDSMKVDPGDGRPDGDGAYAKQSPGRAPREGAVYIVAGCSGKTSGGSLDHPAMFVSLDELGSVVLDLNERRLDVKFIDRSGSFRDYFTMIKGGEEQ